MKKLGIKDAAYINLQREAGKSYEQIAEEMSVEGYVNKLGNPVSSQNLQQTVSRAKYAEANPDTPVSKFGDIKELMDCNLSERLKERFLAVLVQD